ncbi:MAG: hypothetical protein AAGN35_24015 [Bacteroidota bacterium]
MRKYIFVALVAFCLAIPGMVAAGPVADRDVSIEMVGAETDPASVNEVLKRAAEQCPYDHCELVQMYADGEIWIEKMESSYRIWDGGGGLIDVILDDF